MYIDKKNNLEEILAEARKRSIEVLRSISIDEKLTIVGEMMDAIAKIKMLILMKAVGCSEKEAINILRERLMKLQEIDR